MPVASLQGELIESSIGLDMSIPGGGVQLPVHAVEIDGTISRVKVHVTLQFGDIDLPVAGAQIDSAFTRHLDDDIDPGRPPPDDPIVMGIANLDLHRISCLSLLHPNAAFADLVPGGDDLGF